MKLFILNPPALDGTLFVKEGRCMNREATWENLWPPVTLATIYALLKDKHEVRLVDGMLRKDLESVFKEIEKYKPDATIINTATPTIYSDLNVAKIVKDRTGCLTVMVGIPVTGSHEEIIKKFPQVDYIVRREPEYTCVELFETLDKGGSVSKIKGITYRKGKKTHINPDREFIQDLDALPFPDRTVLDNKKYTLPFTRRPFTLVSTSRGCPGRCVYCLTNQFYGRQFRMRSAKNVVDEIEDVVKNYGLRDFLFWADEFTCNNERVYEICDEIKRRGLKIRWFTNSRTDTFDYKLAKAMRESGCWLVSFGLESGSQEILNNVRKGITIEQQKKGVRAARKAGIEVIGHFIFGLPGETRETAEKTIGYAKKVGVTYAQFYIATPYPATGFYDYCKENNLLLTDDWSKYEINQAVIRTPTLSADELEEIRERAYRGFYLRPSYIMWKLSRVRSFTELKNLYKEGRGYLKDWVGSKDKQKAESKATR